MNISESTTMLDDDEPKKRGRPAREETRRRRKSGEGIQGKRLGIAKSMLDLEKYAYRWINDTPARVMMMTKEDDWDIVTQTGGVVKEDATDLGGAVAQVVGRTEDGKPLMAYLCRKPRAFYDEDQRSKAEDLDKQLAELRRGHARDGSPLSDYVPNSGISISR